MCLTDAGGTGRVTDDDEPSSLSTFGSGVFNIAAVLSAYSLDTKLGAKFPFMVGMFSFFSSLGVSLNVFDSRRGWGEVRVLICTPACGVRCLPSFAVLLEIGERRSAKKVGYQRETNKNINQIEQVHQSSWFLSQAGHKWLAPNLQCL